MKRITLGLAVLLSSFSSYSFAQTSPFNVTVPCYNGGLIFGLAGLYSEPSTSELDYALIYPNDTRVNGKFVNVDSEFDWGYQAKLGYLIPGTGTDVLLTYTSFQTDQKDHVNHLANGSLILGTVVPTEFVVSDSNAVSADAKAKFDYRAIDLDMGQHVNVGCRTQLRFLGGVRYADLKNNFDANYFGNDVTVSNNDSFQIYSTQQSHFRGVGPRLGVDANYQLGNGFGIVGQTTAALLVGSLDSKFNLKSIEINNLTDEQDEQNVSFKHPNETRVVPNLTAKLGADYTYHFCNQTRTQLTLEAGYQVDYFHNSTDRLSLFDVVGPELRTRHTLDTSFQGPYVALKVRI